MGSKLLRGSSVGFPAREPHPSGGNGGSAPRFAEGETKLGLESDLDCTGTRPGDVLLSFVPFCFRNLSWPFAKP